MTERRVFFGILIAYLLLATVFSIIAPPFEASDELWHYPMVKYLADNGLQLPPQDPGNPGPWRQEGSQPPLYYMIAAILTSWIDTSNMDAVRRVNPHADIGIVRPDGNINMMIRSLEQPAVLPAFQGTLLALWISRVLSIVLGAGTVVVTYQLGKELFPDQPIYALGAMAFTACIPMFLFISGSVNNDNLSNFVGNWLTLQVVRLVRSHSLPNWHTYGWLGLAAGVGLLAKLSIGFFIPLIAVALLVVSWRLRNWRPLVIGGFISGTLTIVIAGWWYLRNWQLYGDPSGVNMFLEMVGRRTIPANTAQLWSERHSFTQAYWGFFGGVNVPLPEPVYLIFNGIGLIGLVGAAVYWIAQLVQRKWSLEQTVAIGVTVVWPLITFISYLRWTAETPASQGRLLFVALSSISLWMIVGWLWWLKGRLRVIVLVLLVGYGFAMSLLSLQIIRAAYAPPLVTQTTDPASNEAVFNAPNGLGRIAVLPPNSNSDDLVWADLRTRAEPVQITPESYVQFVVPFRIEEPTAADWSLFAHLVTSDGVIVGQRDVYPGGGLLATSDLQMGDTWNNRIAIWLPTTAYAPMELRVTIGWYNLASSERMRLADGGETLNLGTVQINPRPDAQALNVPNPIRVNFGNLIELVGYEVSDLSPAVGDSMAVSLYWRAMQPIADDYKVFVNVLDVPTLTKYAASDGMPVNWQAPTSTWTVGTVIEDTHTLTVNPDSTPGIYDVELGLYRETESGFERLRIVTVDGGMAENFIYLNRVRIVPTETP
jgi:4-amino-4-deoxy-L-arabinose transferase-like glycosyltransferase